MNKKLISEQIDGATRLGHEQLAKGNIDEACSSFEKAVELAERLKEGFTERACYFNLGACYVARGDPNRGVEYLKKSFPPNKELDGRTNYADLQYNLGTAYDALSDIQKAVECYEIAAEEYKAQKNLEMRGETLLRLGKDWTNIGDLKKAAEIYQQCAEIFQEMGDKNTQLLILNNLASLLGEIRDIAACGKVLAQVIELCQDVEDNGLKCKVYNDIGLVYSGLKSYENAAECFELALPLMHTENSNKELEAVLQQNLGAVYNQLKQYNKAMECHRQAVSLHGEHSNRVAQGQSFCNMGFAQSQLGEYKKAGESFSHAIQAAKDSDDKRGLWQAYEGLAAVSFLSQEYDKAVEYYKLALSVLSTTGEAHPEHNSRIVSKLTNALECQLIVSKQLNGRLPPIRLNSMKSDVVDSVERSNKTGKRVGKTRSRQEHHQLIARGIDGDQTTSEESEGSGSGEVSTSSDEEVEENVQGIKDRHMVQRVTTTAAEVHQERKTANGKRERKMTSTSSTEEEHVIRERERRERKYRQSQRARNLASREPLKSTQGDHIYEQVTDDRVASPARSNFSGEMPRAHREAYLASVQASSSHRPDSQISQEEQTVQSRTCIIQ